MKTILIFSNPFGYGPAGKALSIAEYIQNQSTHNTVYLCGGKDFELMSGKKFKFINVNVRDVVAIQNIIKKIPGRKYIISSQNRFAIKAALEEGIPSAFLDGLAWFWGKIPDDHFIADIIFWLNYPNISQKIPLLHKEKISVIHGIAEKPKKTEAIRKKILLYIGGCQNPLTPLPFRYLDMVATLIISLEKDTRRRIILVSDTASRAYFRKEHPSVEKNMKRYDHASFIKKISSVERFIGNGGQTATLEASTAKTPISFFLPINLSQLALIEKLTNPKKKQGGLSWRTYIDLPTDFHDYTEKEAILFLDQESKKIVADRKKLMKLCKDFKNMLAHGSGQGSHYKILQSVGSNGAHEIYETLKSKWLLN